MNKKNELIPVTIEDVAFIFNRDLKDFYLATSNCYCRFCNVSGYGSTITNYTIQLNDLYDIVLKGFCLKCSNSVGRYIETGDNPATAKNAEAIWNTDTALKELKIKRTK